MEDKQGRKGLFTRLKEKLPRKRKADELPDDGQKKKMPKKKKIIIICSIAAAALLLIFLISRCAGGGAEKTEYEMLKAERRDINRTVNGSSTLEANDTYNVTALVTGEILSDPFNEGDVVTKDQLLYQIDSEDAKRSVSNSQNSLSKAQQSYADAVKKKTDTIKANSNSEKTTKNSITKALENVETAKRNLATAQDNANNLTITANYTGTVKEVLVKEGSSVNDGTQLASIYNDAWLKIQIPFNESDAAAIAVGSGAELTIASSGDKLYATVDSIAGATTATPAHAIVRYVTLVAQNPGGLKAGEKASAVINGVSCNDLGTFENYEEGFLTAKSSGRLDALYLEANDHITAGQIIGSIDSDNTTNAVKNAESSYRTAQLDLNDAYTKLEQLVLESDTYSLDSSISNARLELDNARLALETAQKKLDDYKITAPIDGTIIVKNKKTGDKLEQNNNNSNEPMAIIYDMSVLKVKLDVDESDIQDVKVGQKVRISADASNDMFSGEVTKVGINGTSENGVTSYPVEITITDYGSLLPGMNVDCVIEVSSVSDVIAIPVSGLQRGNRVYLKGDKTDENDRAPEGFYTVKVETGATDSQYIEIRSGLEEGAEVCGPLKASGVEAEGNAQQQTQQRQGGMGGPPGGGYRGGGMR